MNRFTAPSTSGNDGDIDMGIDETSTVTQPGSTPQEGQLWQNLQTRLDAVSQRQDEMMELIDVLRERREG